MELQDTITSLKGIGEKKAVPFAKAGIHTIGDLLQYYPRSYDTFEEPVPGRMLEEGTRCSVYACVLSVSGIRRFPSDHRQQLLQLWLASLNITQSIRRHYISRPKTKNSSLNEIVLDAA